MRINTNEKTPDNRVNCNGAPNSYGFRPLTEAGVAFVNGHAVKVKGRWQDGVFWFSDMYMPHQALNDTPLRVVAGISETNAHDHPWCVFRVIVGSDFRG